jgi:chemotaxis signal transduction protein
MDRSDLKPAPENVRGIQGRQFKGVFQEDGRLVALLDMAAIMSIEDRAETARSE